MGICGWLVAAIIECALQHVIGQEPRVKHKVQAVNPGWPVPRLAVICGY